MVSQIPVAWKPRGPGTRNHVRDVMEKAEKVTTNIASVWAKCILWLSDLYSTKKLKDRPTLGLKLWSLTSVVNRSAQKPGDLWLAHSQLRSLYGLYGDTSHTWFRIPDLLAFQCATLKAGSGLACEAKVVSTWVVRDGYISFSARFVVFKFVELVTYWPWKGQADDMSIHRCVHVRLHVVMYVSTKNSERLFATMKV